MAGKQQTTKSKKAENLAKTSRKKLDKNSKRRQDSTPGSQKTKYIEIKHGRKTC